MNPLKKKSVYSELSKVVFWTDYWMILSFFPQALGVNSSKDRDTIRKRVKDLKSAMEKERKERDRLQKERERMSRQAGSTSTSASSSSSSKKKKFPFGK